MRAGELFHHNLPIELASMIGVVSEDDHAVSTARAADNEVGGVGIESPLPAETRLADFQAPARPPCKLLVDAALDVPALVVYAENVGEEQA